MNKKILQFLVVGTIGFAVDAGLVAWLTHRGMSPVLARVPSLSAGIIATWLLNRRLTFAVAGKANLAELLRYAAVAGTTALLNYLAYVLLLGAGLPPVVAIATATLALMFFSFFGYRSFAFRVRPGR